MIRQWVDGRPQGVELTPFENVGADDYGIDLLRPWSTAELTVERMVLTTHP